MKRIFMMAFAIVAVAITGCSQNKENKQDNKADTTVAQINNAYQVDKNASSLEAKSVEGKVNDLTTSDFKKKVMDYEKHPDEWVFEGNRPAIIDFYATWCRPCKMTAPVVEELAKDYQGKIDIYKVDIDNLWHPEHSYLPIHSSQWATYRTDGRYAEGRFRENYQAGITQINKKEIRTNK